MAKISVVVPVYNGSKTLRACIASVIAQNYEDMEIIAVDDGSTDDSAGILREYSAVRLINQDNAGVSNARNKGVELSNGDYIAFIDQDDVWSTDKLTKQMILMNECKNIRYIFCNFKRFDHNNVKQYPLSNSELNDFIYTLPFTKHMLNNVSFMFEHSDALQLLLRGYPIYPSTMLIEKKLLIQVGGWNSAFPRCQDLDLSLKCTKFSNFCYVDEVLAGIGRHETNVSAHYIDQLEEDISVLQQICNDRSFNCHDLNAIKYYLGRRLCGLGWHHSNFGNRTQARKYYFKALNYTDSFARALLSLPFTYYPLNCLKKNISKLVRQ